MESGTSSTASLPHYNHLTPTTSSMSPACTTACGRLTGLTTASSRSRLYHYHYYNHIASSSDHQLCPAASLVSPTAVSPPPLPVPLVPLIPPTGLPALVPATAPVTLTPTAVAASLVPPAPVVPSLEFSAFVSPISGSLDPQLFLSRKSFF